ncbi:sedoheptulokinase-like isoform X2 [Dendronephthya gigantea]|uniref:sedoheptulokinase-like isoform X2 n=1 Tax=Dendronephthya gigantea TaxID=151771 RepID=UPI00106D7E22|nr:sedoheptulokinase-like isoform X2 [Dendronephthya gigantea]
MADNFESLTLGIDIGTTSIKTVVMSSEEVIARNTVEHCAEIILQENGTNWREQDVQKLFVAIDKCIKLLPKDKSRLVKDIVVCGQMHGCVLWNKEFTTSGTNIENLVKENFIQNEKLQISSLFTWEDKRCSTEFLSSLPKSSLSLYSGFGCATLFWLQRHQPDFVSQFDSAGTIMDLVVSYLCSSNGVYISTQNACSWGYYDIEKQEWEIEKLQAANFPVHLLPTICPPGYIVGHLSHTWENIQPNATVRVALGDMQCSILATNAGSTDAVLNIGTSAQLSVIINESRKDEILASGWDVKDAFKINFAIDLFGGNVLAYFVKTLKSWLHDLGYDPPPDSYIYQRLFTCGVQDRHVPKLTIHPVLWGERHDPEQKAFVKDILPGSLSLGNIYNSICFGLLVNIHSMIDQFLTKYKVTKLVGTGNALLQNKMIQENVREIFRKDFETCEIADAAMGAAMSINKCST